MKRGRERKEVRENLDSTTDFLRHKKPGTNRAAEPWVNEENRYVEGEAEKWFRTCRSESERVPGSSTQATDPLFRAASVQP